MSPPDFGTQIASERAVDALLTTAASGLRSRLETIDLIANNLANAGTPGFKADRESYSTYFTQDSTSRLEDTLPTAAPFIEKRWTDYSQGSLSETGNPFDFALSGTGFFVVQRGMDRLYTRNGSFGLSSSGEMITKTGDRVLDTAGDPIRLNSEPVTVAEDGSVYQGERAVAKLAVIEMPTPDAISKNGATYYSYTAALPTAKAAATIHQGKLENSNFSPVESAVGLVQVMRQFEMLQRAVTLGSELNRRSIEDVGKI